MLRIQKFIAAAIMAAFLTGCVGQFALTKEVYKFNLEASEEKFVDELLFLALNVVPVYGIAAAVDAIVLNSIEFWTDENPMSKTPAVTKRVEAEDGSYADMTKMEDGRIHVQTFNPANNELRAFYLEKGDQSVSVRDENGELLAHKTTEDLS